jgi:hypothetical protein
MRGESGEAFGGSRSLATYTHPESVVIRDKKSRIQERMRLLENVEPIVYLLIGM